MIEIRYDRGDRHQPNMGTGVDALANEMEEESIDVWNGVFGLVTLGEANDISDDTDFETDTEGHGRDISPDKGNDPKASSEASGVEMLTPGNHPHSGKGMIRPRISEGCRMDHVKSQLEYRRGQRNVTKNKDGQL